MLRFRGHTEGISLVEVLVATLLVAIALLGSLRLNTAVLAFVGRTPTNFPEQKPTRLRAIATAWSQAHLEFLKQIGFDSVCDPGIPPCEFWAPQLCDGTASSWPLVWVEAPPIPTLPTGQNVFFTHHVSVSWDGTGPPDPDNPGNFLLVTVQVDVFRDQVGCNAGNPFLTTFTSLSRR